MPQVKDVLTGEGKEIFESIKALYHFALYKLSKIASACMLDTDVEKRSKMCM